MTTLTAPPPRKPSTAGTARPKNELPIPPRAETHSSQHLATTFLVRGCERALFDLRCSIGQTNQPRDVRVGLEAAALLEQVLAGWRDTLRQLSANARDAEL
jgi:hypothetical protein